MKDKTVFRVEKNKDNPFVMIDRRPIENPALSWKAKGILAYLLSRPDDWVIQFRDLVKRSSDGAHTVRESMKELRKAGHVRLVKEYEGGRIKRWIYQVYEVPILDADFQQVEKLEIENRAINNKKLTNKKLTNTGSAPAPKEPKAQKPTEPKASDFPELVLYRGVVAHWPKRAQRDLVIDAVRKIAQRLGRDVTADDLTPWFQAWSRVSPNDWSLVWLDWAIAGQVLPFGSRPPISTPPAQPPVYSQADLDAAAAILAARASR